jgi:hypothetical protein
MARGHSTFRKRDVTAAVKAVAAAGLPIEGVEIDKDGKIKIIAKRPGTKKNDESNENEHSGGNPWDNIS